MIHDRFGVHFSYTEVATYGDTINYPDFLRNIADCADKAAKDLGVHVSDLKIEFGLDWSECYYEGESPGVQLTFNKEE